MITIGSPKKKAWSLWLCKKKDALLSWNKCVNCFSLQLETIYFNSRDKVRVVSHLLLKSLQEGEICCFSWPQTLFILHIIKLQHPVQVQTLQTLLHTHQYGYDPSVFLLNQVTDDLVVEELNWLPLDRIDVSKPSTCLGVWSMIYYNILHIDTVTSIPSASYSSCSAFSVSWMKSCCSFSLQ